MVDTGKNKNSKKTIKKRTDKDSTGRDSEPKKFVTGDEDTVTGVKVVDKEEVKDVKSEAFKEEVDGHGRGGAYILIDGKRVPAKDAN